MSQISSSSPKPHRKSFVVNNKVGEETHKDCVIESYYKLKRPQQLSKLALQKEECDSFLRWRRYRKSIWIYLNRYKSDKQTLQKHQDFKQSALLAAKQQLFHHILDFHGTITTSSNKKFRKILMNILETRLLDETYRKKTWMIASNGLLNMSEERGYYDSLKQIQSFPDFHSTAIRQDVLRTEFKMGRDDMKQSMENILICYQRRNPVIGYCQGMNNIVFFLLKLQFTEEEIFWILTYILESVLPIDYFPNFMLGLLCDLKIVGDLLKYHNPRVWKKLQAINIDTSIILTHWLVCMFTTAAQHQVLLVIWDHLFAKGSLALFKASLIFLDICQEEILASQGVEVLHEIESKVKGYDDAVTFNSRMSTLYISKKAVTVLRDIYRQIFHLEIEKDEKKKEQRLAMFEIKRESILCKIEWPICHHFLEREKLLQEHDFDNFVLRQKAYPPVLTERYFVQGAKFNQPAVLQNEEQRSGSCSCCSSSSSSGQQNKMICQHAQLTNKDVKNSEDQKKNDRDSKTETEKELEKEKETADFKHQNQHISQINKANDDKIPNCEYEEEKLLNELKDISIISIKKDSSPIEEEDLDEHAHQIPSSHDSKLKQSQEDSQIEKRQQIQQQQAEQYEQQLLFQQQQQPTQLQQPEEQPEQQGNENWNLYFESFLQELSSQLVTETPSSREEDLRSLDDLFIMRTPHICQVAGVTRQVTHHQQQPQHQHIQHDHSHDNLIHENPLKKYINSFSFNTSLHEHIQNKINLGNQNLDSNPQAKEKQINNNTNHQRGQFSDTQEQQPEAVQFINMLTPREGFSDLVLRDVSNYDQDIELDLSDYEEKKDEVEKKGKKKKHS